MTNNKAREGMKNTVLTLVIVIICILIGFYLGETKVHESVDISSLVTKIETLETELVVEKEYSQRLEEQDSTEWEVINKYVDKLNEEDLQKWYDTWKEN